MSVLNIAHRGGAGLWPENTLAAFRNAAAMGADGAELDVQLSSDGEVIVFHDYRLKPEICRGPDGKWLTKPTPRIKDLTFSELRSYDIGRANAASDYAREHPDLKPSDGERIPLLAEVIAIAKSAAKPFRLFIELKTSFADRAVSASPEALAERTLAVLKAQDFVSGAILVGFDWPGLLHAKKLLPEIECWFTTLPQSWFAGGEPPLEDDPPPRPQLEALRYWAEKGISPWAAGYDAVNYGGSILHAIKAAGGDGWFPMHRDATDEAVAEARALGLKIGAWTVDDPAGMRALIARGLDAICTDRPDILLKL
ncbi:MAG TPA: glycerophosphodiester phosphodiesterase family protein [Rhizomicrobium sp.]|nr:glycerophosphodiester phosphodiesterase family protein [Rhizomicrobium sp.]